MHAPCAAFVLAGGRSSRMGVDKALAAFAGEPLVVHALRILRAAGLEPAIAGARSPLASFAPVVEDEGRGPLDGICCALASTAESLAVFLPVDQPLAPPQLIHALVEDAEQTGAAVVLPRAVGFTETFPAVLDCAVLPLLRAALEAGQGGCFRAFQQAAEALGRPFRALPVELLAQTGRVRHPRAVPASFWCLSVNTPADLVRAQRLMSRAIA
jgi:molybdopterin-guanine dinucleotide biosynthesis protein A